MKKLMIMLLFVLFVACEPTTVTPPTTEIDCDVYPTHKECVEEEPNEEVIDNPYGIDSGYDIDNDYTNLGQGSSVVFDGRDLVPDDCSYLDNIGDWQPVWCDEFDYVGYPDDSKWSYDVGGHGWGNNELQYYTEDDLDNAFVEGGVLVIRTIQEQYEDNNYTSARLVTKNQGDWLYGKVQVRAKVPAGLGTWPAIWMLPTDWSYGGWPNSGEIDIMEYVGYDPNLIHGTIHTGAYNHMLGTQVGTSKTVTTAEEEFHLYEMEWEVGVIRLYIDGVLLKEFTYHPEDNTSIDNYMAWPFDQRFHLILNTAFGGNWGGALGIDESIESVDFVIDYVRVYQKDYAGMDTTAPDAVTNVVASVIKDNSIFVTWDKGTDDVLVKEYEIYNGTELIGTTTVNGLLIDGLSPDTTYDINVIAIDFTNQSSQDSIIQVTTLAPPIILDRVEAEDYDTMAGVDTENTSDTGGGQNVGWIDTGDYLTYQLIVEEAGSYQVDFRISSPELGAFFDFYQDTNVLFTMDTTATGGWQNWETFSSPTIVLQPGTYTFKLVAREEGFNINYFEFRKVN